MWLEQNLIKVFSQHLNQQRIFGTSPFILIENRSNPSISYRSMLSSSCPKEIRRQNVRLVLFLLVIIILSLQCVLNFHQVPFPTTIEAMMYVLGAVATLIFKFIYTSRRKSVCAFFNFLLAYESSHLNVKGVSGVMGKGTIAIIRLTQIFLKNAAFLMISGYVFSRCLSPCSPTTLGYFLIQDCICGPTPILDWGFMSVLVLTGICAFCGWLLLDMEGGLLFQVGELLYIPSCCIQYYIKHFQLTLRLQLNLQKLVVYRELQLLTKLYNLIHQDVLILTVLCAASVAFTVNAYALLVLGAELTVAQMFLFPVLICDGLVILVIVFGSFGGIDRESLHTIEVLKNLLLTRPNQKYLKMYLKTFIPIRIGMGEVNYVDMKTPLMLLDFNISVLVNLLLL